VAETSEGNNTYAQPIKIAAALTLAFMPKPATALLKKKTQSPSVDE